MSLVSRRLRDNSCAASSYHGPTPARHGRPVVVRTSQVTRSSPTAVGRGIQWQRRTTPRTSPLYWALTPGGPISKEGSTPYQRHCLYSPKGRMRVSVYLGRGRL